MAGEKIFIVNADEYIRESVKFSLWSNSYQVFCLSSGVEALRLARREKPRLIILDLRLPDVSGMEVLRSLKENPETSTIKVLILSVQAEAGEIVEGLELGAEDYLTKPFHPKVLLSRIRSLIHNGHHHNRAEVPKPRPIVVNREKHEVIVQGESVPLTNAEFKLLDLLAGEPGKVFTRDQIIQFIHGAEYAVSRRSVDVLVSEIRKKHRFLSTLVHTVRGVGYKMREDG